MPESRRRKIESHKHDIAEYLHELDEADDAALWEKASANLHDVLVVHRRGARDPEIADMRDEQLAVAFRDAVDRFMLSRGSVGCVVREGDGE
jgi:hypothetical protein